MRPKRLAIVLVGLILPIALIFREDTSGGLNPRDEKAFSSAPVTAISSQTAVDDLIAHQAENYSVRWFYSDTSEALEGVALVIHGLNLRPDRMQPIISKLTAAGIDVLRLSLRGHGNNYTHSNSTDEDRARLESFKNVSYPLWINEACLAYLLLQERGAQKQAPLFLVAFSLGGLIGLDLFASHPDVQFDKVVLFAPAIRLHATIYLERLLSPFPRLVIPSMAPKTYLANRKGTPIAAYNALFEGLSRFNKHAGPKLNVPTLILIDEQDEFIPLGKLKNLVAEKNWNQWQFYMVEKDESAQDDTFYHHIIDPSATGNAAWRDIMTAVVDHLLDRKSR